MSAPPEPAVEQADDDAAACDPEGVHRGDAHRVELRERGAVVGRAGGERFELAGGAGRACRASVRRSRTLARLSRDPARCPPHRRDAPDERERSDRRERVRGDDGRHGVHPSRRRHDGNPQLFEGVDVRPVDWENLPVGRGTRGGASSTGAGAPSRRRHVRRRRRATAPCRGRRPSTFPGPRSPARNGTTALRSTPAGVSSSPLRRDQSAWSSFSTIWIELTPSASALKLGTMRCRRTGPATFFTSSMSGV